MMERYKIKPAIGIIAIILGALTAMIPKIIFPVCANMLELVNGKTVFMKCHWTAMAALLIGFLIMLDGILLIGFKKHDTRIALSILLFCLGLITLLMTTVVIGVCASAAMPCRMGTQPALIVVSVLTMAVGAANIIFQIGFLKKENI